MVAAILQLRLAISGSQSPGSNTTTDWYFIAILSPLIVNGKFGQRDPAYWLQRLIEAGCGNQTHALCHPLGLKAAIRSITFAHADSALPSTPRTSNGCPGNT
ncbi:MAG: hypothetical protein WBN95_02780, partial [Gammaproteobacteria bacterium]